MSSFFKFATMASIAIAAPALGHHGWSAYDTSKPIRVTAPLSAVTWGHPHGTAKVAWRGKTWDVILAPTSRMKARGLSRATLTAKKPVTLIGYPRRDGRAEMRIETVLANGKRVELR